MSTRITLQYFGVEGTGPTVKAAKEDAGRKLQSYVETGPCIHIVGHPKIDTAFILWREIGEGWQYRSIPAADRMTVHRFTGCCMLGALDEKGALCRTVAHLAGLTQDAAAAKELIYRHCGITADYEWRQWRDRAAFQLAAQSFSGDEIQRHRYACEHAHEFLDRIAA